ncbi:MAG TPA: class I SAM-dependent methyltransferase [Solirubrobacteraceae bacterium]|nr:class I SAM-dependent methyltransferase [Solirubrobacteraceae bacterium]
MRSELPDYFALQDETASRCAGAHALLELGTGTGETALRVLERCPGAALTGIDVSADMLAVARQRLPDADLRVARLEDPLPAGRFDLVFSVLAIHHLDGPGKADLFRRVAAVTERFVIGDVIEPEDPADAVTPLSPGFDMPSPVEDQLGWLRDAGFAASVVWSRRDPAIAWRLFIDMR